MICASLKKWAPPKMIATFLKPLGLAFTLCWAPPTLSAPAPDAQNCQNTLTPTLPLGAPLVGNPSRLQPAHVRPISNLALFFSQALGVELPAIISDLIQEIANGKLDPARIHFFAVPGNQGSVWANTGHNAIHSHLPQLMDNLNAFGNSEKQRNTPVRYQILRNETFQPHPNAEVVSYTNTVDLHASGKFLSASGEVYLKRLSNGGVAIFMRSLEDYNSGGPFFSAIIWALGGQWDQVTYLRDDLNLPRGRVKLKLDPYGGNNALKNFQLVWQAQRYFEQVFKQNQSLIETLIDTLFDAQTLHYFPQAKDQFYKNFWQQVAQWAHSTVLDAGLTDLEAPNFEKVSRKPWKLAFSKFKENFLQTLLNTLSSEEKISYQNLLEKANSQRSEWRKSSQHLKNREAIELQIKTLRQEWLNQYLMKNGSRKLVQLFEWTIAFESAMNTLSLTPVNYSPRAFKNQLPPITNIGVGTDFKHWLNHGGFQKPLPRYYLADPGTLTHFVLSPLDFTPNEQAQYLDKLKALIEFRLHPNP